ncbi:hypothetical protein SISNIDRAFT_491742 [Sistotremastrum niveocremeum HHB9708]|uniref:Uncharacterized protein n=1 Tax=Sistotremastrum niveocremeum HHB9708 TaxID=1314777 RepID=A0A164MFP8_9AGAM|nr:hypothetical protein SISNIDRAFT_491742 [Sistotremastrum niveocremeum HHB9708]
MAVIAVTSLRSQSNSSAADGISQPAQSLLPMSAPSSNFISQIKGVNSVPEYMFQIADALEDSNADATAQYTNVKLSPCHFVKCHQLLD